MTTEAVSGELAGGDGGLDGLRHKSWFMPSIELVALGVFLSMVALSYFIVTRQGSDELFLTPFLTASLLVALLVPAMFLMVLIARRIAQRRAARSPIGGKGRLHVRLVALFSGIAAVPTLLVVIFASLLFQYGVEFWFSERARDTLENAGSLAQDFYLESLEEVEAETRTMAADLAPLVEGSSFESPEFVQNFAFQVYARELSDAAIFTVGEGGDVRTVALVNPDNSSMESRLTASLLATLDAERQSAVNDAGDRFEALARFGDDSPYLIYASRASDPQMQLQTERAQAILNDYDELIDRGQVMQLRFNVALLVISLLIVAAAIWIALTVADRLVRPVGALVQAARKVADGDLSTRVPEAGAHDEIGTLASAFNGMTGRLEEQTGALVLANDQLDSRRAFIEAVLSSVTAGVVSVDSERRVRLINRSAAELMEVEQHAVMAKCLKDIAPELDRLLDGRDSEKIIQMTSGGEPRTLAVTLVEDQGGHVLTFDDITQQLLDQRRAAWSDVARRIAHEIKNPLTPIQLAAERLQRRFGDAADPDSGVFAKLTGTIVRQVGDLRRMVDEFSSFARMPKPVFREESIVDIARQAVFLHEVAHPEIAFEQQVGEELPPLVCDRRQLGQALTNVVKNAVEAVEQKHGEGEPGGLVRLSVSEADGRIIVDVEDNGVGLPAERERLTEPYMTTRESGTGLGLAIVKKIVEEHFGTVTFSDRKEGGTRVRVAFDVEALAPLKDSMSGDTEGEDRLFQLTRNDEEAS
ncbi:sensor histidine kinase [Parasphingopyxis algicola]|uniref:sensor histidine kinase n=1 Tax=Parasphingopyxis algicola TaxID=2026624 RepID=UPI001FE3C99E|nr:ATP-binding protein [Parasphingopyxis algicola]